VNSILKFAVAAFAVALIVAGAVLAISPIPGGMVVFAVGVILLAVVMPSAVRGLRRRWKFFDRLMHRIEKILPKWLARKLKASDYDHAPDEVDDEEPHGAKSRARRR
jgi:hypothetical protein